MVIVDTSVWIEFFKGNNPYYSKVLDLIENRAVRTIEPIFAELLQGALTHKEKDFILKFWEYVEKVEDKNLILNAGIFSFENKLVSKGIKLIDACIIYSSIENNCKIWTLDKKMLRFLDEGIIYNQN